MSIDERSASRAEARRRARLAARGKPSEPEAIEPEPDPRPARGGFLTRMFPPAPALPNRPDPLAGYTGSGPLRFVTERVFLLRRNPLAWILPGIIAFVGYVISLGSGNSIFGLIGTFVLFGSLIAAGWFGWQRPALFGVAAAMVGFVITVAFVVWSFAQRGAGPDTFGTTLVGQLVTGLYLGGLGFLGGWYGGYLRRRQTQLSSANAPRNRRR